MKTYLALVVFALCGSAAWAQTLTTLTPMTRAPASDKKVLGWIPKAQVGFNLSFTSNQDVVGQTNGSNQTYGLNFKGEFNHVAELSEWRNALSIQEGTSKTAALPRWTKANDDFKYETMYLYSLPAVPEIGPYVSGSIETTLFNSEDIQPTDTNYRIHPLGGGAGTALTTQTLHLTDSFKPMTTKESAGFFWKAIEKETITLETRLGLGAMQVQADGQYAVGGKNAAGEIDVNELRSFQQFGVEAGVNAKGKINDNSNWESSVSVLTPLTWTHAEGDDRGSIRLTNIEAKARLVSKIVSWASFSYDYKFLVQPQLVDQTQQTHMLVLNINYNLL
jgi:hypothetical protein